MRKEILLVIFAGVLFGVIIAFGIWRADSALKPKTDGSLATVVNEKENTTDALNLTINDPESYDVFNKSPIVISGITKANSWVVVSLADEDFIFTADDKGLFEQEIELSSGVNQILVYVFDEQGNSRNEKLTLVYSTQFETD